MKRTYISHNPEAKGKSKNKYCVPKLRATESQKNHLQGLVKKL